MVGHGDGTSLYLKDRKSGESSNQLLGCQATDAPRKVNSKEKKYLHRI